MKRYKIVSGHDLCQYVNILLVPTDGYDNTSTVHNIIRQQSIAVSTSYVQIIYIYMDRLVQEKCNSIDNTLELSFPCTNALIYKVISFSSQINSVYIYIYIYIQHSNLIIAVLANVPSPGGARPLAGNSFIVKLYVFPLKFLCLSIIQYSILSSMIHGPEAWYCHLVLLSALGDFVHTVLMAYSIYTVLYWSILTVSSTIITSY